MPLKQEDIFRLVYEIATDALIVANARGEIVDSNESAEKLFKYSHEQLVGMNVDDLLPDSLKQGHAKHRQQYAGAPQKRRMGSGMELSAKDSEGNFIPVEVSLNHAGSGDSFRVVALISDISTRKEAEQRILQANKELEDGVKQRTKELDAAVRALEESQHLHTLIAQNFPDGTINVLDKNLRYIFAEGKEFARSGIDRRKVIGLNYISLLPQDYRDTVVLELNKVFEGFPRTFDIETRGNSYIMTAVPLFDENEGVNRILLVEKNVSEQKQAEKDMVAALKKEREVNELKSRFVSMASHEFRTPLATVLSSINLVSRHAEKGNQESIEKHVGRIRNSVRNLTSILNDFLSLEKLEQGKVLFKPEGFDMCDLAISVTDDISGMTKRGQEVVLNCCDEPDCKGRVVHGLDPQLIRNILFNLLSNAVKYSSEGAEIQLNVEIKDKLKLQVIDQGMGIPEDEQGHLFERFFRAKNATNIQGTGLGLNIVKKHVELMGGDISYTSKLNEGTTFVITLPTLKTPVE